MTKRCTSAGADDGLPAQSKRKFYTIGRQRLKVFIAKFSSDGIPNGPEMALHSMHRESCATPIRPLKRTRSEPRRR